MDTASVFAIAFAIGVVADLRSFTAPAVVGWAAHLGRITQGGYATRTRSVAALKTPDFAIALIEDAIAVGGGLLLVSHL